MNFEIKKREGFQYAKSSGDNNKIHLNNLVGYNSIFGENICHGTLILKKFLNIIKFNNLQKKKNLMLDIEYYHHFSYDKKIIIKKRGKRYYLEQDYTIKALITFENINTGLDDKYLIKNLKYSKKINSRSRTLDISLDHLSKFVGTIYPGEFSIIRKIKININYENNNNSNLLEIFSKKTSNKYPFIENVLKYKNLISYFTTLERPKFIQKKNFPSNKIKTLINKIDRNILIIGSSSGIGNEVMKILSANKKIKIIGTYKKNKIKNFKNVKFVKVDLEENINSILNIINKFQPINIYYFATPKIDTKGKKITGRFKSYKNFYIKFPEKILKFSKNKDINFFYPSTSFVDQINSDYAKIKKHAEKKLILLNPNIKILRIEPVHTKQNLNYTSNKLPTFVQLLNKKINYQKKLFFF